MPAVDLHPERAWLERLRRRYHHRRYVDPDPLALLYPYEDPRDREIVGLIAACLAYGNVKAMLPAIRAVLDVLGPAPAAALAALSRRSLAARLRGFRYRFTSGAQIGGLLVGIQRVGAEHGGLEPAFAAHQTRERATVLPALEGFVQTLTDAAPCPLTHLLPCPSRGSACKRLNLYLRWMVRADDVDPGGWRAAHPRQLLMPIDTHVHQTALARGWTRRRAADLRTAVDVTAFLRTICADDPLRYDFAITRPGIRGERRDLR